MLRAAAARQTQWTLVSTERELAAQSQLAADSPEARAGELASPCSMSTRPSRRRSRSYRERVGSACGVTEPASVSLQVLLVRAGEKQATWRADFTQTQEPLAYNLLNFWKFTAWRAQVADCRRAGENRRGRSGKAAGGRHPLRGDESCAAVRPPMRHCRRAHARDFGRVACVSFCAAQDRILSPVKRIGIGALLALLASPAQAARIYTMEVRGPIFTPVLQYLSIALDQAEKGQATALLLELDTPGGALDTTKEIVQTILGAPASGDRLRRAERGGRDVSRYVRDAGRARRGDGTGDDDRRGTSRVDPAE